MVRCVCLMLVCSLSVAVADDRPNILFLLADDQRPDTIAALGNDRIQTPNLDGLVRRGTVFTQATCSYPICVVSRAEMLTGMHGWENGIDGLKGRTFKEGVTFWARTLRDSGYATWYVGKWHSPGRPDDAGYAHARGLFSGGGGQWWKEGQVDWKGSPVTGYRGWVFQSMDGKEKYPERGVGLTADISSEFADAAIDVIRQKTAQPWFLHVNFTAPHDPLFMPPGYEAKYDPARMLIPANFLPEHPFDHGNLRGRDEALMAWPRTEEAVRDVLRVYYSVVDDLDHQVGRILSALEEAGVSDNTIIIYASDHGLAVGSHGLRGKQNMYEHTINVPLIVAGPGIRQNHRSRASVYLRDLYPTTCELAGVKVPSAVTAHSFRDVLQGEPFDESQPIYGYFTDTQRMIRVAGWKLIHYPQVQRWQLFDLRNDPHELNSLHNHKDHQQRLKELQKRLEDWRIKLGDPVTTG